MTDAIPKIQGVLYTAKAHTTGGRDGGSSRTMEDHTLVNSAGGPGC